MAIKLYEADTLSILISWSNADGSVKDMTGATVEAAARDHISGAVTALTAIVSDGAQGEVLVTAPSFSFGISVYEVQVVATKDGEARTHAETLTVLDSIKEP
jgi:hypothetical protein